MKVDVMPTQEQFRVDTKISSNEVDDLSRENFHVFRSTKKSIISRESDTVKEVDSVYEEGTYRNDADKYVNRLQKYR